MPFTIAAFITRLPTVSPTDFQSHYEDSHLPLFKSTIGEELHPKTVTRYYVKRAKSDPTGLSPLVFNAAAAGFEYDLVAFMTFDDEPSALKFQQKYGEPGVEKVLAEDIGKVADVTKFRVVGVEDALTS